jgi:hypothetical protein
MLMHNDSFEKSTSASLVTVSSDILIISLSSSLIRSFLSLFLKIYFSPYRIPSKFNATFVQMNLPRDLLASINLKVFWMVIPSYKWNEGIQWTQNRWDRMLRCAIWPVSYCRLLANQNSHYLGWLEAKLPILFYKTTTVQWNRKTWKLRSNLPSYQENFVRDWSWFATCICTVVHPIAGRYLIARTPPNLTQVKIWEYLKMETLIEHD